MMKTINFGVWGYGRMGAEHGKFYSMEKDQFKFVAACDTDAQRLERAKADYHCAVYTDSETFLADPNMELVVISTLSLDHTRHAVQALESGKIVLLDKPIAITDEELETLRQADEKNILKSCSFCTISALNPCSKPFKKRSQTVCLEKST